MDLFKISSVAGLPEEETETLNRLLELWQSKLKRNQLRYAYYSYKNTLKNFGIAIPDSLASVETVVGWPTKAVDSLAVRSRFEGFVIPDGDDSQLHDIVLRNRLRSMYQQAARSELVSSCSFLTVSAGGEGEPSAVISAYSTLFGAAEWDRRRKRIKSGFTVIDTEKPHPNSPEEPSWVNLYMDDATWEIKKEGNGWTSRRVPHDMGRPLMEPLVFRPSLDRPFGMSRITRAVMSITDSAVREALRTEIGAEFYTAPQKYILGADEGLFDDETKWEAYIGNILALTPNEDGDIPQVGMFSQGSMQPHTDYMRSLAARFSGETSIPISELGVVHDNPSSAEAIYAAKESLVCEAEDMNAVNGDALREIARMAIAIGQGKPIDALTESELSVEPRFKNPALPSLVSQADAIVKAFTVLPWLGESRVAMEELGFNDEQIRRLESDKKKAEANAVIANQAAQQQVEHQATMYEISSIIKAYRSGKISRNNAIVLFSRIGIDGTEAEGILNDAKDIEETIDEAGGDDGNNTQSGA